MDDSKPVVEEKAVEQTTTQASSPQAEVPTIAEQTPTLPADAQLENSGEPNEPKFQTEEERKAFQDMRLENKRLKEEIQGRVRNESAFAVFKPNANVAQDVNVNDYVDQITGDINRPAYNAALQAVEARKAAYVAQQSVNDQLDEYQARNKFPDVFANPRTEKLVAAQWFFEKTQGNNVSISEIAEEFARDFQKAVTKAEKIGAEKALEQVTPKEQAALQASSQTSAPSRQQTSTEDLERLRQQSRGRGRDSDDAVVARLKGVPWAK